MTVQGHPGELLLLLSVGEAGEQTRLAQVQPPEPQGLQRNIRQGRERRQTFDVDLSIAERLGDRRHAELALQHPADRGDDVGDMDPITAIGLGLFVAAALAGAALPVFNGPPLLPLPHDLLLSALAATGFAVLFGAPRRALCVCILCGMAGHGLRTGLQTTGIDIASATLIAAAVVGSLAVQAGRRLHLPWTTFAFPGVVAMIPGSYGFRAAAAGLEVMNHGPGTPAAYVADTLSLTISTVVLTAAIGTGLLFASALSQIGARPIRKKPQERAVPIVH